MTSSGRSRGGGHSLAPATGARATKQGKQVLNADLAFHVLDRQGNPGAIQYGCLPLTIVRDGLPVKGSSPPPRHAVRLVLERVGLVALFALQLVATLPTVSGAGRRTGPSASGNAAITSDGSFVFVVNPDSGSVSAVDTRIDRKIGETRVGDDPRALALSLSGRYLYVTSEDSATLTVLDTSRQTPLATIRVGAEPYGVVADPGGQLVYVASSASASIEVVEIRVRYPPPPLACSCQRRLEPGTAQSRRYRSDPGGPQA